MIVVNVKDNSEGLVVAKVSEVISIPAAEIELPSAVERRGKHDIAEMGKVGQQVEILLDLEALLEDEGLEEIESV